MKTDYLILGGGRAAEAAIEGIRTVDTAGSIVILSNESILPYSRPMLTKLPLEHYSVTNTLLHPESWYSENHVQVFLDTTVKALDAENHIVSSTSGDFTYRKCICALGAYNFIPPFEGSKLPGVFNIRTNRDMDAIRRYSVDAKNAVVIGGGVIGLEAAYLLCERGLRVTVLETAPYLMPRLLDEESANDLRNRIHAFEVKTAVKVLGISGDCCATAVRVEGMEPIPADIVIVSCGVRANSAVLQQAGAACERAIVVDERMETSLPDVYACGDCAQFRGMNTALWAQATLQGRVAGMNAAGKAEVFTGSDMALLLTCPEFSLYSDGDCGKKPELTYEIRSAVVPGSGISTVNPQPEETFIRDFYVDGRLVGTFMVGNLADMLRKGKEIIR